MNKSKATKRKRLEITKRDIRILLFLWKWKVISTAGIAAKFFPNAQKISAYHRLKRLYNSKYIRKEFVNWNCEFAWKLTKKGYNKIYDYLPEQTDKSRGYGGEHPRHDFLVSAFHIGDWLISNPKGTGLVSEQLIRRQVPKLLPNWVPRTDFHTTDGYWFLRRNGKESIVALEVELTQKAPEKYKSLRTFYNSMKNINYCIWVMKSKGFAARLLKILNDDEDSLPDKHQFLLADDVAVFNWEAKIILGSKAGISFSDFMKDLGPQMPLISTSKLRGCPLVEPGISVSKSTTYKLGEK